MPTLDIWKEELLFYYPGAVWCLIANHLIVYQIKVVVDYNDYKDLKSKVARMFTLRVLGASVITLILPFIDIYLKEKGFFISDVIFFFSIVASIIYFSDLSNRTRFKKKIK